MRKPNYRFGAERPAEAGQEGRKGEARTNRSGRRSEIRGGRSTRSIGGERQRVITEGQAVGAVSELGSSAMSVAATCEARQIGPRLAQKPATTTLPVG